MTRPNWHYGEQRTPEWFALKAGKASGSKMATILAHGRDGEVSKGREDLKAKLATERDTGVAIRDGFDSEDIRNGIEREPFARALTEQVTGEIIDSSVCFIDHPTIEWLGVSPDGIFLPAGIIGFPTEGWETKCPRLSTFTDRVLSRKVPTDHQWQCQTLMECGALSRVRYTNYHPDRPAGQQLLVIIIERDDRMIRQLVEGVCLFNQEVEDLRGQLARARYLA